jgi:dihydroorotate dehydrogenase (NAD+) catalytic subunit
MATMRVKLGEETLRNPVVLSAGTCGVMGEIGDAIDLSLIGAITTKSITKEPRIGNEPIRIADLPNGMINAIGLANEGIDSFIEHQAPKANAIPTTVIASVAGDSIDTYVEVASAMNDVNGINLIEINVSCPNTSDGMEFGGCPKRLTTLLNEIKPTLTKSGMIVKLSASAGDIRPHATAAIACGADALTLINTIPGLAIDVETMRPRISRGIGGFSGCDIHPIATRIVHEVYRDVAKEAGVPIIGTGGVMNWKDAAEFILAGASAVGIGTASFVNPTIAPKIAKNLSAWVGRHGCANVDELVGAMKINEQVH